MDLSYRENYFFQDKSYKRKAYTLSKFKKRRIYEKAYIPKFNLS